MKLFALSGEDILAQQHLTRWHMVRMRRHQSLAEHVGTVAMLSVKIAQQWGMTSAVSLLEVIDHALTHDAHEVEFGDLPAVMKSFVPAGTEDGMEAHFWRRRGPRPTTTTWAKQVVDLADKLEATIHYTLEGRDPTLQKALEESLATRAALAPPAVESWIRGLVGSVKAGGFTPQPTKAPA